MNIAEVSQQLSGLLSKASSLFLAATDDFAKNLTMGQMIKGKVLRSYDAGRYAVDFNGHEKVVDSSIPLKTGEVIQGRVVAIGDKVELKRIHVANDAVHESAPRERQTQNFLGNKWDVLLRDIALKYQLKLSAQDKSALTGMLKAARLPEQTLLAAVVLMKQGLPISEQLMQMLNALQDKQTQLKLYPAAQLAPILATESSTARTAPDALSNFVLAITNLLQEQQSSVAAMHAQNDTYSSDDAGADNNNSQHDKAFSQAWQLLNTQIDGSVSHRVCTLPMWLGNQLIEINIAIYEQHKNQAQDGIKYKRLVFCLELEHLGKIEVETVIENKNIRMTVSADQEIATQWLAEHTAYLKNDLVEYGFKLDEISYQTRQRDALGDVVGTVMQHYVSQDSLNRVM